MKKILLFFLVFAMACSFIACADEGKPSDYTFDALESALNNANALEEAELVSENTAKVHYSYSSLKKYEVDSSQRAQTAFRRGEDGTILELSGMYTVKAEEDNVFSVYYKDGYAYYHEADRLYKASVDASAIDDQSLFLSFAKDEIENYRAREKAGVITVTFSVPWESSSAKIVALYSQLANVMQSTGLEFRNVEYKDLSASYRIDKKTGALKSYTYQYSAEMTVDDKKVEVQGTAVCEIVKTKDVQIVSPDLTLYQ